MRKVGIGIVLATAMVAINTAQANAPNNGPNAVVPSTELVITDQQVAVPLDNYVLAPTDLAALAIIVSAPERQSPALTSWNIAINCVGTTSLKGARGDAILPNDVVVSALNRQNTSRALSVTEGVGDLILPNSASVTVNCNIATHRGSTTTGGPLVGPELVLTVVVRDQATNTT